MELKDSTPTCLVTDHKPLLSILHEHRSIPTTVSNHIQRWALYHISFKSSDSHCNADALSRLPSPCITADPPVPCETILLLEQLDESPVSVAQFVPGPAEIQCSHKFFNISCQDGLILWIPQIVH